MASTPVTRASLVTRFLQRANTSGYIEPTVEAPQLVDTSLAKCYNWMVGLYEDYFLKKGQPLPIVGGRDTYALPDDCMKPRKVDYVDTSGARWPLVKMDLADLTGVPLNQSFQAPLSGYVLAGNDLIVYPFPSQSTTGYVQMWYIPTYQPALNDSVRVFPALAFGWEEWVVVDACIAARSKAMMPMDDLLAERADLERKLLHQMKNRDAGAPPRVRDTGWNRWGARGWSQFARR